MGEADALEQAEEVELALEAEFLQGVVGREIVDADLDRAGERAELRRQIRPGLVGDRREVVEIGGRGVVPAGEAVVGVGHRGKRAPHRHATDK